MLELSLIDNELTSLDLTNFPKLSKLAIAINTIYSATDLVCYLNNNELAIRKLSGIPVINIVVDESSADSGLITRLESFVDIIKERRNNE